MPLSPIPAAGLRHNVATWAVAVERLPAVAAAMRAAPSLAVESFDPAFRGQALTTTYFDTASFALRKARRKGDRYLTLRIRCYQPPDGGAEVYALSAKTEADKWRGEIAPALAAFWLDGGIQFLDSLTSVLPPDLVARLMEMAGDEPLLPAVAIHARRYAVENERDRLTLDCAVRTDLGKRLGCAVLEFKSTDAGAAPPDGLTGLGLHPLKLSKFLWATEV
jgi:hypothetical protein